MSARQNCPLDNVARKWVALAERRVTHIIELYNTGRWRHYYTQAGLLEAYREATRARDEWARIAGLDLLEGQATGTAASPPPRANGPQL